MSPAHRARRSRAPDPWPLDAGDAAQTKVWQTAIIEEDINALLNEDLLLVHLYTTNDEGDCFAERHPSSATIPSSLGGAGGGSIAMPIDVTFGGIRAAGAATVAAGVVTFTPDAV